MPLVQDLALASAEAGNTDHAAADSRQRSGVFIPRGINIRPERMLRVMGYREGGPVRPVVLQTASAVAEIAEQALAPTVHHRRVPIESRDEGGIDLPEGISFRSPAFGKHLSGCNEIIAFVLTLGRTFDNVEKNLVASERMLEAVFLEAAGWVAVEEATRIFTEHLAQQLRAQGLALSRRLAPGYSFRVGDRKVDWPLEDQKPLFAIFGQAPLPVELLDSCAMTPKMSRTGLFGLRPELPTAQQFEAKH
jgi:hypothetical protein